MKDLFSVLKHHFIPHHENEYKPHFFREGSIVALSFVVTLFFFGAILQQTLIRNTSLFAEVFPQVLVELANMNRQEGSLGRLRTNTLLQRAAELKAQDMAAKGYFAHTSPEGVTPWHWFEQAGYDFAYAGENLAVDFSDSVDVDKAWMASPAHRANILGSSFNEIGIATARGVLDGRETTFVVQMFGRAKSPVAVQGTPANVLNVAAVQPVIAPPAPIAAETPVSEAAITPAVVLGETETNIPAPEAETVVEETLITTEAPVLPVETIFVPEVGMIGKFVSSPTYSLSLLYAVLALFVAIGLGLMFFIKIKIQHPRNIAYGFGIIALIGFLFFIYQSFAVSSVVVG